MTTVQKAKKLIRASKELLALGKTDEAMKLANEANALLDPETVSPAPAKTAKQSKPKFTAEQTATWLKNKALTAGELLGKIAVEQPTIRKFAYRVGKWVWLEMPKPEGDAGKEVTAYVSSLGFRFNAKRKLWQHAGGSSTFGHSDGDPREQFEVSDRIAV